MSDARAEFARLSAVIELRLEELRQALARHEAEGLWDRSDLLERVERGLAEMVTEVQKP